MIVAWEQGGTHGRVLAFDKPDDLEVMGAAEPFLISKDPARNLRYFIEATRRLLGRYREIDAIGFSIAGKLNDEKTGLAMAGNLTTSVGRDLVTPIWEAFRCPVGLINDCRAAAWTEAVYGPYAGMPLIFVVLGTGINICLVTYYDGQPIMLEPEGGHVFVGEEGEVCGCGQTCCAEAAISGRAFQERLHLPGKDLQPHHWEKIDPVAARMVHSAICFHADCRYVAWGGGVALGQGRQRITSVDRHLVGMSKVPRDDLKMGLACFGDRNGLHGARLRAGEVLLAV